MNEKNEIPIDAIDQTTSVLREHVSAALGDTKEWVESHPEAAFQVALAGGFLLGAAGLSGLTVMAGALRWLSAARAWLPPAEEEAPAGSRSAAGPPLKH